MDKSYDELVKRLQTGHDSQCAMSYGMHEHCCDCSYVDRQNAADAIVALQARVAELEQLLTHTGLLAAQEEHNAMRHDIARHVQIAAEQARELEELRAELAAARAALDGIPKMILSPAYYGETEWGKAILVAPSEEKK